jgi:hypothetical protein
MYVLIILGSDKTTVSVATGDVEYHPLYILSDKEFRDFSNNEEVPQTEETQQLTINTPIIAPKQQLTQPQSSAQAQTPT